MTDIRAPSSVAHAVNGCTARAMPRACGPYPPKSGKSRRFKNDTERLEKLFELYTKMTTKTTPGKLHKTGK